MKIPAVQFAFTPTAKLAGLTPLHFQGEASDTFQPDASRLFQEMGPSFVQTKDSQSFSPQVYELASQIVDALHHLGSNNKIPKDGFAMAKALANEIYSKTALMFFEKNNMSIDDALRQGGSFHQDSQNNFKAALQFNHNAQHVIGNTIPKGHEGYRTNQQLKELLIRHALKLIDHSPTPDKKEETALTLDLLSKLNTVYKAYQGYTGIPSILEQNHFIDSQIYLVDKLLNKLGSLYVTGQLAEPQEKEFRKCFYFASSSFRKLAATKEQLERMIQLLIPLSHTLDQVEKPSKQIEELKLATNATLAIVGKKALQQKTRIISQENVANYREKALLIYSVDLNGKENQDLWDLSLFHFSD